MVKLVRSLLFVPGNNQRFINKAITLNADIVCLDLEDSVPDNEKQKARELIYNALDNAFKGEVYVRVNSPNSKFIVDDIKSVVRKGLNGIVIPKVNESDEVKMVEELLSKVEEDNLEIIPSIESAMGVVNAYSIARASKRVTALLFGIFDFLNDLGIEYNESEEISYLYARSKVAIDARAAGVYAIDSIWQKVDDIEGLVKDAMIGKKLGYKGKSIIHPNQIEPVHNIFKPSKEEIEWAKKVVETLELSMKEGRGAAKLDGKMIDAVHYKRAKAILDSILQSSKP